jgi:mannose-6-phosphate isomerase class I
MKDLGLVLEEFIDANRGVLKLKPNYVRRYYRDGGRLLPKTGAGVAIENVHGPWTPERWIASTVTACNPESVPNEGLSLLDIPGSSITLKDALSIRGEHILGPQLASRYAPNFPLLSKVFDPYDPIVFHFHARDEDVRKFPEYFAPNESGKEEAYYFLSAPKGRMPYTHVGLRPGVTKQELSRAIDKGGDYFLDLSPAFSQAFEEGFHVPAGIPHRPGTALTLELQQPSDVYTHLDWFSGGEKLSPQQIHPGFDSLEKALDFIDWESSVDSHILEKYRIVPEIVADTRQQGQGEEAWIFPPRMTRKFSGKRVRVTGTFEMSEDLPHALLVWRGQGELNGKPIQAGDEFFVTYEQARTPNVLRNTGSEVLEVFKLFPPNA